MEKGPISQFITHHYRHFNSAALVDAAKAYDEHMNKGGKMMLAMAGAMSTAELGLSLAEMIRQDKIQIVSCSANNLEEDIMNLVAHNHYYRVPNYRDLTPEQEKELLDKHMNRVTASDEFFTKILQRVRLRPVVLTNYQYFHHCTSYFIFCLHPQSHRGHLLSLAELPARFSGPSRVRIH